MRYFLGLACVFFAWPAIGWGQGKEPAEQTVESLLAADSIAYFRYDGYEPHKKAYDQSALGHAMKDDLGEFFDHLASYLADTFTTSFQEKNPGDRQQLAAGWRKLVDYFWRHGLAAGVELTRHPGGIRTLPLLDLSAEVRLTLVFPEGGSGKNRDVLVPLLNILVGGQPMPVGQRLLYILAEDERHAAWWQEGRHIVLVLGNGAVETTLDMVEGRRPNLQRNPLFRAVADFKDYETDIRGFVDVRKLVDVLRRPAANDDPVALAKDWLARNLVLNQLGLTSVHGLTYHLGFDRQYQRSTVLVSVAPPGQRAGLARLLGGPVDFDPTRLPALPPDAASVRVGRMDWKVVEDYIRPLTWLMNLQELFGNGATPPDPTEPKGPRLDVCNDILAHLDSTLVLYNSFAEGPFFLGQGIAVKVKDEKKLDEGLQKAMHALESQLGGGTQKLTYRGVDLYLYSPQLPGIPVAPAFTIHKGWLVLGLLPQTVKGYILRSEGKHQIWQAPPLVAEALAKARTKAGPHSKLAALTVTDPRPTVTVGLSLLPAIVRSLDAAGLAFDVAKVPNAQAVTEWQFPGVTVLYDDGNALRWESHAAFELPGEWMFLGLAYFANSF